MTMMQQRGGAPPGRRRRATPLEREDHLPDEVAPTFQRVGVAPPAVLRPSGVLALQRGLGNQAVQRLLAPRPQRGAATPSPAAVAIQRYTQLNLGGLPWRLADSGQILVQEEHGKDELGEDLPNRSHFLWAAPALLGQANRELETAGSFIRLIDAGAPKSVKVRGERATLEEEILIRAEQLSRQQSGDEQAHYFAAQDQLLGGPGTGNDRAVAITRILPRYVGPGAGEGKIDAYAKTVPSVEGGRIQPVAVAGEGLTLPSDCNKAARVIMGIMNDPVNTAPPPEAAAEAPVTTRPGARDAETVHGKRKPYTIKQGGGAANLAESGGLTALSESLVAYVGVVSHRPVYRGNDKEIGEFFRDANIPGLRDDTTDRAWKVLHDMQTRHPHLYRDFAAWAGIDAAATPKVGEALVTYRVEGIASTKIAINTKAYAAMLQGLTAALSQEKGRSTIAAKLGAAVKEAIEQIARAEAEERGLGDKEAAAKRSLAEAEGKLADAQGEEEQKAAQAAVTRLRSTIKNTFGVNRENARKSVVLNTAVRDFLAGFLARLGDRQAQPADLAKQGLELLGIKPDTLFDQVKTALNQQKLGQKYLGEDIDIDVLKKAVEKNDLWNKHWAGVIMTDGGDYVSLENDASTDTDRKLGKLNSAWGFMLYGSAKEGQSFHAQMMAGGQGDFGNFASTLRYRRPVPGGQAPTEPAPQQGTGLVTTGPSALPHQPAQQAQKLPRRLQSKDKAFWRRLDNNIRGADDDDLPNILRSLNKDQLVYLQDDYRNDLREQLVYENGPDQKTLARVIELVDKILKG